MLGQRLILQGQLELEGVRLNAPRHVQGMANYKGFIE